MPRKIVDALEAYEAKRWALGKDLNVPGGKGLPTTDLTDLRRRKEGKERFCHSCQTQSRRPAQDGSAMMQLRWLDDTWVRRVLFVGVDSAAVFVVAVLVIGPVRDVLESRDVQIAEQQSMLARFMAVAVQEATVEAAMKQASADEDPACVFRKIARWRNAGWRHVHSNLLSAIAYIRTM